MWSKYWILRLVVHYTTISSHVTTAEILLIGSSCWFLFDTNVALTARMCKIVYWFASTTRKRLRTEYFTVVLYLLWMVCCVLWGLPFVGSCLGFLPTQKESNLIETLVKCLWNVHIKWTRFKNNSNTRSVNKMKM